MFVCVCVFVLASLVWKQKDCCWGVNYCTVSRGRARDRMRWVSTDNVCILNTAVDHRMRTTPLRYYQSVHKQEVRWVVQLDRLLPVTPVYVVVVVTLIYGDDDDDDDVLDLTYTAALMSGREMGGVFINEWNAAVGGPGSGYPPPEVTPSARQHVNTWHTERRENHRRNNLFFPFSLITTIYFSLEIWRDPQTSPLKLVSSQSHPETRW